MNLTTQIVAGYFDLEKQFVASIEATVHRLTDLAVGVAVGAAFLTASGKGGACDLKYSLKNCLFKKFIAAGSKIRWNCPLHLSHENAAFGKQLPQAISYSVAAHR